MAKELSERQRKILEFIRYFIGENRFPPTIREIGEKVGISSTSVMVRSASCGQAAAKLVKGSSPQ